MGCRGGGGGGGLVVGGLFLCKTEVNSLLCKLKFYFPEE